MVTTFNHLDDSCDERKILDFLEKIEFEVVTIQVQVRSPIRFDTFRHR